MRFVAFLPACLIFGLLTGCVTSARYQKLHQQLLAETAARQAAEQAHVQAVGQVQLLQGALAVAQQRRQQLVADSAVVSNQLGQLRTSFGALEAAHEKLLKSSDQSKTASTVERGQISRELWRREYALSAAQLKIQNATLKAAEDSLVNLTRRLRARDEQVRILTASLGEKEQAITELRQQIASAKARRNSFDTGIGFKNGDLYIQVPDDFLSGPRNWIRNSKNGRAAKSPAKK